MLTNVLKRGGMRGAIGWGSWHCEGVGRVMHVE